MLWSPCQHPPSSWHTHPPLTFPPWPCLLLSPHLGRWHPLSLLCSTSPFDSAPTPLPSSITPLHIQIFVCHPPALGCFTLPYITTRPPLTVYHFLFPHLLRTSMPPGLGSQGTFVTLVTGSPLRQEVTQEVHLQTFQTGNCKEESDVCVGRDVSYKFTYANMTWLMQTADYSSVSLTGIVLLNSVILVYCYVLTEQSWQKWGFFVIKTEKLWC